MAPKSVSLLGHEGECGMEPPAKKELSQKTSAIDDRQISTAGEIEGLS